MTFSLIEGHPSELYAMHYLTWSSFYDAFLCVFDTFGIMLGSEHLTTN